MSLYRESRLPSEHQGFDDDVQRESATFDEFIPPGLLPPSFQFQPVNTGPTMVIPTPKTAETTIDTHKVKAAVMATPTTAAAAPGPPIRAPLPPSPPAASSVTFDARTPLTPPMTDEGQTSQDSEEVRFVNPLHSEPIHVIDHYAPNEPPPTQDADPWAIADPYEFVPPHLRPPHAAPIPANHPGEWSELPPLPQPGPMSPKSQKISWNRRFAQKAASPFNHLVQKTEGSGFLPDTLEKETEKAANIIRMFCSKGIYADIAPAGKKKKRSVATIPPKIMARARGLAIFTTLRASISISSSTGSGIVISRLPSGRWSAPSAIRVNSFGGGIVAGIDIYDCICVINTDEALAAFMSNRVSMGSDLAVAAGPWGVGRNVQVGTALKDSDDKKKDWSQTSPGSPDMSYDMPLNRSLSRTTSMDKDRQDLPGDHYKPVFSYVKSRGLYAGLGFDGTFVLERKDANRDFYGHPVSVAELLHGHITAPDDCEVVKKLHKALKDAEGGILTAPSEEDFEPIPYEPTYEEPTIEREIDFENKQMTLLEALRIVENPEDARPRTPKTKKQVSWEDSPDLEEETTPRQDRGQTQRKVKTQFEDQRYEDRRCKKKRHSQKHDNQRLESQSYDEPSYDDRGYNDHDDENHGYDNQVYDNQVYDYHGYDDLGPEQQGQYEEQSQRHSRRISWQGMRTQDNEPPSWEQEVNRRASTQGWPLPRARPPPINTHQTQYYQHAQWRAPLDEDTELMMEPVSPVSSVSTLEDGKAPSVVSRLSDEWVRPSHPQEYFTGHTGTWYTAQNMHGQR